MRLLVLFFITVLSVFGAEKLTLRYFHDKENENLAISKIKWLTEKRAIAIGVLEEERKVSGVTVETSDGGITWQQLPFKEIPQDLYFLDDSFGWIATDRGIWHTEEGGRSWKKIKSQKGILAIHFFDSQNGIIAGVPKMLMRTQDGGRKWSKVTEADAPSTRRDTTAYSVIEFVNGKLGQVIGFSSRTRARSLPSWMEPEDALKQKQRPTALIILATGDAGLTWRTDTASVFGRVSEVSFFPDHSSLSVFQFDEAFQYPGEVFHLGSKLGNRVYREKGHLPTDVLVSKSGPAYLAVIEQVTELRGVPIPGQVKILRATKDGRFQNWSEISVDYRAIANEVHLSEKVDGSLWAVTDNGMILELVH